MRPLAVLVLALTVSVAVLAQQRFDFKVREDMFAGMDGDTAAFDRAMKLIADTLAADPTMPRRWCGAAMAAVPAGQAFRRGASAKARLWRRGLADMDRAVALAQRHRGPRAARIGIAALRARPASLRSRPRRIG